MAFSHRHYLSIANGCRWCIRMHTEVFKAAGRTADRQLMHYLFHAGTRLHRWQRKLGEITRLPLHRPDWLFSKTACPIIPLFLRGAWLYCHTCRNFNKTKLQEEICSVGLSRGRGTQQFTPPSVLSTLERQHPSSKQKGEGTERYWHSQVQLWSQRFSLIDSVLSWNDKTFKTKCIIHDTLKYFLYCLFSWKLSEEHINSH